MVQQSEKKKKPGRYGLLLFGVLLALMGGCSFFAPAERLPELPVEEYTGDGTRLFYLNKESTRVISDSFVPEGTNAEEQIWSYLAALEEALWSKEERARVSQANVIQGFNLHSDTQVLTLYLASDYTSDQGIVSVLKRAAIVKTLCQVPEVSYVEIYIGAQPLMHANGKPVGMMMAGNFIENTGKNTEFYQVAVVTVHFADVEGDGLREATLQITHDGTASTERLVLEQLIKGPVSADMQGVIPEGTELNKINVKDGVCYVDFNEKFLEGREGVRPEITIYSIVYSLTDLANIYKVQFLIDGRVKKEYQGMDISSAFERNLGAVEGE